MTHDEFDAAYQANLPRLLRTAKRILHTNERAVLEDVVADAVCRCLANIERCAHADGASVYRWMDNSVVWQCKDYIRLQEERRRVPIEEAEEIECNRKASTSLSIDVSVALDKLLPEQKLVMRLLYTEGYTLREVEELTGLPNTTIRRYEETAIDTLRRVLEGYQ